MIKRPDLDIKIGEVHGPWDFSMEHSYKFGSENLKT